MAAVAIIGVMVAIARSTTGNPEAQATVTTVGYRLRRGWLWALAACAVAAFALSLPNFPYARPSALEGRHYPVIAFQYGFEMPKTIPLNQPVVFDVTSKDVNHGFGIYGPDGKLFAQVQAMPDYVNHLALTFKVAGHYVVRCLEYCGIAHYAMQGAFDVR